MGTNTYSKDQTRIREKMAALLAGAREQGDVIAEETALEIAPLDAVVRPAKPRVRGPQKSPTKQAVSIRLDADLVEELRRSGRGWQTRLNEMLRRALDLSG